VSLLIDVIDSNDYRGGDNYNIDDNGDERRNWRWFAVCVRILYADAVSQVNRFSGVTVAAGSSMDVTVWRSWPDRTLL
jgi:hypothetical protein